MKRIDSNTHHSAAGHRKISNCFIEPLESRIAPAVLTFPTEFGTATIRTSKGTDAELARAAIFPPHSGQLTDLDLDLASFDTGPHGANVFQGTTISITGLLTPEPGLKNRFLSINVGEIDAPGH